MSAVSTSQSATPLSEEQMAALKHDLEQKLEKNTRKIEKYKDDVIKGAQWHGFQEGVYEASVACKTNKFQGV